MSSSWELLGQQNGDRERRRWIYHKVPRSPFAGMHQLQAGPVGRPGCAGCSECLHVREGAVAPIFFFLFSQFCSIATQTNPISTSLDVSTRQKVRPIFTYLRSPHKSDHLKSPHLSYSPFTACFPVVFIYIFGKSDQDVRRQVERSTASAPLSSLLYDR